MAGGEEALAEGVVGALEAVGVHAHQVQRVAGLGGALGRSALQALGRVGHQRERSDGHPRALQGRPDLARDLAHAEDGVEVTGEVDAHGEPALGVVRRRLHGRPGRVSPTTLTACGDHQVSGQPPSDAAVTVAGVSKSFRLPHEEVHTLKERVLHPMRRRSYDELHALRDISFEVEAGEFFGIVGRNGSGKTTLMKCLAGIYRADEGEIWARGRIAPFIELGVGFNPDLTARDNVLINAVMLGLSPAEARERYGSIVEFAELERFTELKLKNYSSGMHVRLAFAVMVHVEADVLLIDEVLAVGDSAFQRKCHDALMAARGEGRTILLVTHDMNAVQRFCDRALLVDDGELVTLGDPRTASRRYEELNMARYGRAAGPAPHGGDGSAAILDTWVEDEAGERVQTVAHGSQVRVRMEIELRADAVHPAFGFVVSDEQGRMILALASEHTVPYTGRFSAGERVTLDWSFECILASGRYSVSPEARHSGQVRRLMDHRESAGFFEVTGARSGVGMVDLAHELEVTRTGARAGAAGS